MNSHVATTAQKIEERKAAQARVAAAVAGRAEMSAEGLRADRQIAHGQRSAEGRERQKRLQKSRSKRRREEKAARAAEAEQMDL